MSGHGCWPLWRSEPKRTRRADRHVHESLRADVPLWTAFEERDRRFLVQAFRIIEEEGYPYYVNGRISEAAKETWATVHARLSTELGLKELSARAYSFNTTWNGKPLTQQGLREWNTVCERFVCVDFDGSVPADEFMKARMSFFEIALRELYAEVGEANERLQGASVRASRGKGVAGPAGTTSIVVGGPSVKWLKDVSHRVGQRYKSVVEQFNARLRQARLPLHYHNGFIQLANDEIIASQIEEPFWKVVSDEAWRTVDEDMKVAVDRRDSGARDAALYAARALEGAIKIVSDRKGWTRGDEKGAHGYLDNLGSDKNGAFIAAWERDTLKTFFSAVRNPLAHAPGGADTPKLSVEQTAWTIESCMSWIKSLIRRM